MKKLIAFTIFLLFSFSAYSQLNTKQQKQVDSLFHEVNSSRYDTTIAASLLAISEIMYVNYVDTLIPLCNKVVEICEKNLNKKTLTKKEIESC